MTGKVKWFDKQKGFGFIICEDGSEVFAHQSDILMDGFRYLTDGDKVEFETGTNTVNNNIKAINVKKIMEVK